MIHLHLTALIIAVILFIAVFAMYKKDNTKENKTAFILHMVLRLFYVIILVSGLIVYISNMEGISNANDHMRYGIKALLGLLSIGLMEVSIVRLKKQSAKANMILIVCIISIAATVVLGAILPLGMLSI